MLSLTLYEFKSPHFCDHQIWIPFYVFLYNKYEKTRHSMQKAPSSTSMTSKMPLCFSQFLITPTRPVFLPPVTMTMLPTSNWTDIPLQSLNLASSSLIGWRRKQPVVLVCLRDGNDIWSSNIAGSQEWGIKKETSLRWIPATTWK